MLRRQSWIQRIACVSVLFAVATSCGTDAVDRENVRVTFTDEPGRPTRSVGRLRARALGDGEPGAEERAGGMCCTGCNCSGPINNPDCQCSECHPC